MTLSAHTLPRLVAGLDASGPLELSAHDRRYGQTQHGLARSGAPDHDRGGSRARNGDALVSELERAGVRGMGGGSFPTATKLAAVAAQGGRPVVVVNGTEGEPLSRKDLLLLSRTPHLVLDGAIAVARALGAREIVIAHDGSRRRVGHVLERAIAERPEIGGRRRALAARSVATPRGYITGQETALVSFLNGGAAKPAATPPYPFEAGVGGNPTLISNAETFAQVALVARHGAEWYRSVGTASAPGSRLVTVAGSVVNPGTIEVAGGTELTTLLQAAGGVTGSPRALLLGGYAGTWVGADDSDGLTIDESHLRERRLTLGAGIVFVLGTGSLSGG